MPRRVTKGIRPMHWLPPKDPFWDLKIDSSSKKTVIWSAECTRAICPEIGSFKIVLDNNNKEFSEVYSGGETVEFSMDRSDGTTLKFKGEVDSVFSPYDNSKGFTITLSGNHISGELLTILVTESYSGDTLISDILEDLNTKYLTGYTINYTASDITTKPTINWNEKPFWQVIDDLRKQVNPAGTAKLADAYVDDNKNLNMFDENSIEQNNEAIVMGITLITAPTGIGKQSLTKSDKIKVYGESSDNLLIISTSGTGNKEEALFDSKVNTINMASEFSAANLILKNQEPREGKGECFLLTALNPGDFIWYSNSPQKIQEQIKLYKYTHKFPKMRTSVFLQTSRDIPIIFKRRVESELALQTVTNPFKMLNTLISLTFDSSDEVTVKDNNVTIEDGIIKLSSGAEGTFTKTVVSSSDITSIHLQVKGTGLIGTRYEFSTDGGNNPQDIAPETNPTVPAGTNISLKVYINSAETEIDALALHGK